MAFVVLLLLSLSLTVTVESQNMASSRQLMSARQNALFGLQVAIGQLQKYTGADTRVTAEAGILDTDPLDEDADGVIHPHWTGVWENDTATGAPSLLTWLVSGNETLSVADPDFMTPSSANLNEDNSVELLGAGTTGSDAVVAKMSETDTGRYAYWVSGQQTKALINIGSESALPVIPEFPRTIASRYQFSHLNLSEDPGDSTPVKRAQSLSQVSLALALSDAEAARLENQYHNITTVSNGLLTNARDGGLKTDLTTLLSKDVLPDEYDGQPIYRTATAIESDPWATQSPTWNYLKSYYDLRLDVLDDGKLTPRTGTADAPGISPVIAMFKYGFAGGVDYDNRILVNLYPQLVLYNPYSVTLEGRDYGAVFFGNQMTRQEDGLGKEFRSMPIAVGGLDKAFHADGINYEIAKSFTYPFDLNQRTDLEGPGPSPKDNPPGAPRFRVECPDIPPGAAVVCTPRQRAPYDRYADENVALAPGYRPYSFVWHTNVFLKENTLGTAQTDSINWTIFEQTTHPVFFDVALVDDLSASGVLKLAPRDDGVQRYLYRRMDDDFRQHVFQLTGRIPFRKTGYTYPMSATYYCGNPNPNPGAEFAWAAYSFMAASESNHFNIRPYVHFNPRAKELDPRDIDTSYGDHGHYFYNMYGGVDFPPMEFYDGETKAYIGGGYTSTDGGVESFVLYDVPRDAAGLYSLGQLQHMQIGDHFDEPGYAIGNSWASPHIAREAYYSEGGGITAGYDFGSGEANEYVGDIDYSVVDVSYLLNTALWDGYFFSTLQHPGTAGDDSLHQPVNPRYVFNSPVRDETFSDEKTNAASLYVNGAFNVNSVSVVAWQALLSGLHGAVLGYLQPDPLDYPFFRTTVPLEGSADPWAGFRELTGPGDNSQINALARTIVEEVKTRGPFVSLADFINRRLVADNEDAQGHGLKGALQAAIDRTDINQTVPGTEITEANTLAFLKPAHVVGSTGDGISGYLSQADVLTAIAPLLTVRSDTFVIRSYGDTVNPLTGVVEGRAWCEAVVQRMPDYVDARANAPGDDPADLNPENASYGRRYEIISFRWLHPEEV
jgi:hypothetical protein